ncbi:hypothetical protein EHZ19_02170 [Paraburkholderia bannensis]|uniref:Uncharacterized protein n=1 Tax=Paraburkholderia tropica TaxID=92647 RepID=A0AAQ1GD89_9BURK|nr:MULTISPECIES: hypothetical protein [Paraburkholderia]RQM50963.1 hypothetical protein EHZ19_02170 [Paraburkholderia bannensis]RQN40307.1 hypothetical protein EHZ25_02695 [Paraburkholderia tropica]SEJ33338.1 hypothetical protein SAMN05216550_10445 [Paraburkholderia tropica]
MKIISIYDGEYFAGESPLPLLCEIEGSVTPYGREPFGILEEAEKVLEMCEERYGAARPSGDCMTVVVARKVGNDVMPVVRLDIHARNGTARASIQTYDFPSWNAEPTTYAPDDDAVTILRKVIAAL